MTEENIKKTLSHSREKSVFCQILRNRDGDRFWKKKNQQLVTLQISLHFHPTLGQDFMQSPVIDMCPFKSCIGCQKECLQQPFMKTEDFSNVAWEFTPWMQRWRDF